MFMWPFGHINFEFPDLSKSIGIGEYSMAKKEWRGSFAIPMTPFDDADRIDEQALADEIDFCIESGVGGIVAPVMVSEFGALSEDERRLMVRLTVETSAGRAPGGELCAVLPEGGRGCGDRHAALRAGAGFRDHICLLQGYLGRGEHPGVDPERGRGAAFN
jgi:hypothetical protein